MPKVHRGAAALILCAVIATGAAAQQPPNVSVNVQSPVTNNGSSSQAEPADPFAHIDSLDIGALDAENVQLPITQSSQSLTATNTDNSVSAETIETGAISLQADTFNGFTGIGNFLMNTGNNSNLQGSVSVVVVTPPSAP